MGAIGVWCGMEVVVFESRFLLPDEHRLQGIQIVAFKSRNKV